MHKEKIIVALDVARVEEAREIVRELGAAVGAFKIGLQLFTCAGASFVRELTEARAKIFLDLKFHDIPNTVAQASVEAARLGVWMFNVHAVGGAEMMRRTIETVGEVCEKENITRPKIIGVTVLTSQNEQTLREVGIEAETNAQVLKLAQLTAKCGLDGVVASPLEIELIRRETGKDFLIVTPGIRSDGETLRQIDKETKIKDQMPETSDDQKRVMTAKRAAAAGADYLVIGRPILQAADRLAAVRKILEETATAD